MKLKNNMMTDPKAQKKGTQFCLWCTLLCAYRVMAAEGRLPPGAKAPKVCTKLDNKWAINAPDNVVLCSLHCKQRMTENFVVALSCGKAAKKAQIQAHLKGIGIDFSW